MMNTTFPDRSTKVAIDARGRLNIDSRPVSADSPWFIAYLLLTVSVSCLGTFGNLLVLGALLVHKRLRVLSNVFIGNLAIADLCVTAIINPFSVVGVLHGDFFIQYPVICDTVGSLCIISCTCSVLNIASISLNRYVAICHRLNYHKIYNRKTIPFIVSSVWVWCFLLDLPNYLGWGNHTFDTKGYYCAYDYTDNYSYTLFLVSCGFIAPMVLVSYCYVRIFFFAKKSKERLKRLTKSDRRSQIKTIDLRLLKSIGSIWIMFMLMWTPYSIIVIFDFRGTWPQWFFVLALCVAHTNSSINSAIYAATNRNFREGYGILIRRLCCKVNVGSLPSQTFKSHSKEECILHP